MRERISLSSPVELRLSFSIMFPVLFCDFQSRILFCVVAATFVKSHPLLEITPYAQSEKLLLRRHLFDGLFEDIGYLVLLVDPGFLLRLVSLFDLLVGGSALFEHGIGHVVPGQTPRANRG